MQCIKQNTFDILIYWYAEIMCSALDNLLEITEAKKM